MKNKLIYDIGAHLGQDTLFYLQNSYRVIAVEASPDSCRFLEQKFKNYINNKSLLVLNYAVLDQDNTFVDFYINKYSACNSLFIDTPENTAWFSDKIKVKSQKLSTLFKKYGLPYYCKIDIEGADIVCLRSLLGQKKLPKYLSAETDFSSITDNNFESQILDLLHQLGYKKFKLVEQLEKTVLSLDKSYFFKKETLFIKVLKKMFMRFDYRLERISNLEKLHRKFKYYFNNETSGPFGPDLGGDWVSYEDAQKIYKKHKIEYLRYQKRATFWCDWHATI